MKHFGLRFKFIIFIAGLLITIFGLTTYTLVRINTSTLRSNLLSGSKSFAALATKPIGDSFVIYKDSGRIRILQEVDKFSDLNPNITNVAVVDLDGTVLFSQSATTQPKVTHDQASTFEPLFITNAKQELEQVVYPYFEDFGIHRYSLVYTVSNAAINRSLSELVSSILLFSVAALIVSALLTYTLINRLFLRPMRLVSQSSTAISQGDFDRQIVLNRKDEISDLARSVNTMANALKADIAKLREVDAIKSEFMAIASHNLRTPLTIMSGYLEMLQSNQLAPELAKMVVAVARATRRLDMFSEDMLMISQIEAGKIYDIQYQLTQLDQFLAGLIADIDHEALDKKVTFQTRITPGLSANVSPKHFRNALWHVLDNAIKFTPAGGRVVFSVFKNDVGALVFEVADTGIGIDPAELPKLFTKFHRGTSILTYDYEGTGIGLYLTKLLIDQHSGRIAVQSELGKGTTVSIYLPSLAQAQKPITEAG